jgi:small subunit ribosomal protein S1
LSELARHRVERAEDAVAIGDSVKARVLSVEPSDKGPRVKLSIKALAAADAANAPAPDEVLKATVVSVSARGVHVSTPKGDGYVPLPELGLAPGADHRRAFPAGKELEVVMVSNAGGRVRFSATQVSRVEERKNFRDYEKDGSGPARGFGRLGDLLRERLGLPPEPEPPAPTSPPPSPAAPAPAPPAPAAAPSPPAPSPQAAPTPNPSAPPSSRREDPPGIVRRRKP